MPFGQPSLSLVAYHLERGGMPLHDAVGVTVKRAQLLNIKAQVSSAWAKKCMLGKNKQRLNKTMPSLPDSLSVSYC